MNIAKTKQISTKSIKWENILAILTLNVKLVFDGFGSLNVHDKKIERNKKDISELKISNIPMQPNFQEQHPA